MERNYNSRSNSPKLTKSQSKRKNFALNPTKMKQMNANEPILRSPSDRKGEIHPELENFISSEFDSRAVDPLQIKEKLRSLKSKDSEFEPNDDSKIGYQESSLIVGNINEITASMSKIESPPFKVIRQWPKVWTRRHVPNEQSSIAAEMEAFYQHSGLNYDKESSEQLKMQQSIILKKIFKEIRIDTKMNEYWHANYIKNDFKSINIDKFIENFTQTYPYYLSMETVRNEIADVLKNKETRQPIRGRNNASQNTGAGDDLHTKADEFIVIKPPTASDELNNYIKYSF